MNKELESTLESLIDRSTFAHAMWLLQELAHREADRHGCQQGELKGCVYGELAGRIDDLHAWAAVRGI